MSENKQVLLLASDFRRRYGEELSRLNLAAELVKKAMEFSKRNKVFDAVRDDLKVRCNS